MKYDTSELCDIYQEDVNVVEPLFSNFGGRSSFGGQIITVKCFEDNGLLYDLLEENGRGRVLLVDGGGSVRRALIDADLARLAVQNEWEGIVVYGSVRQVDDLEDLDIGIQAIAAIPVGAAGEGIGETALVQDGRRCALKAVDLVAADAGVAVAAAACRPADTHALAHFQPFVLRGAAERHDATNDFVPGHQRIAGEAPFVIDHREI